MTRLLKPLFLLVVATCSLFGDTATFTFQIGGPVPGVQYWSITSQSAIQISNLAIRTSGQTWIVASLSSSTTPSTLNISVNPTGLTVGTYAGTVEVYSPQSTNTKLVNVVLIIEAAPPPPAPLAASPSSLIFNAVQGATPPAPQTLQIGASLPSGTALFSSTTPSPLPTWLSLNVATGSFTLPWIGVGNAPATIQVSIDPSFRNLGPGTYSASIKFNTIFPDRQVTVPITLNVSAPPPILRASITELYFQYMAGNSAMPPAQAIQITSSGSPLSASISSNATWLSASTLNGTTPFSIDIKVNPTGLAVGTHRGQLIIAATSSSSSQIVYVTLTVTADNRPLITSVMNAASFTSTISPGTWVSIIGKNFATAPLQETSAWLPTSLNGVSAQLSGVGGAYTLLVNYVNPTQINAFVPHEVSPLMFGSNGGARITVTTSTGSASYSVDCGAISPALFSVNGYAAGILFPENLIVGTASGMRTATSGSIVSLFGTGFGQTDPASKNVNGPMSAIPLASNVVVTVGGIQARVLWAGMVGVGLYQINIEVPTMPGPGDYPVVIQLNGTSSPTAPLPVR